jgi:hypothetical protein
LSGAGAAPPSTVRDRVRIGGVRKDSDRQVTVWWSGAPNRILLGRVAAGGGVRKGSISRKYLLPDSRRFVVGGGYPEGQRLGR